MDSVTPAHTASDPVFGPRILFFSGGTAIRGTQSVPAKPRR